MLKTLARGGSLPSWLARLAPTQSKGGPGTTSVLVGAQHAAPRGKGGRGSKPIAAPAPGMQSRDTWMAMALVRGGGRQRAHAGERCSTAVTEVAQWEVGWSKGYKQRRHDDMHDTITQGRKPKKQSTRLTDRAFSSKFERLRCSIL